MIRGSGDKRLAALPAASQGFVVVKSSLMHG
jgi:hypothetical protein